MAIETQAEVKQNTLLTAEDLWRMPDDECRHELVKGEISTTPPAGGEHGSVAANLHRLLGPFVWSNKLGVTLIADTGYILSRDPDTVRVPDLSFVARERIPPNGMPVGYWSIAPDLAVEVISPSEGVNDIQTKVIAYLNAGTRMMWVVFPRTRTVTVYRSLQNARILTTNDTLSGEEVVPGFACQVAELFV